MSLLLLLLLLLRFFYSLWLVSYFVTLGAILASPTLKASGLRTTPPLCVFLVSIFNNNDMVNESSASSSSVATVLHDYCARCAPTPHGGERRGGV